MTQAAQLLLVNGKVRGPGQALGAEPPSAVAVSNGRVQAIGGATEVAGLRDSSTEVVDLAGRTVLPGFIESHAHPIGYGKNLLEVDCRPEVTGSAAAIYDSVRAAAETADDGEWILGWGWDESRHPDHDAPTLAGLDRAAPANPVFLRRTCGHMSMTNSAALHLAGIDRSTPDPLGGHIRHDPDGVPDGLLQENAQGLVPIPEYATDDVIAGFLDAQRDYHKWGITTIHDMCASRQMMEVYQRLREDERLTLRVRPWLWALEGNGNGPGLLDEALALGIRSGFGDEMLRIQGVKFMLDGGVGGRTAAVAEPYTDSAERGILTLDLDAVGGPVERALTGGLRVGIHGIGDRAITVAIDAVDRVAESVGPERVRAMRNRIEHCALPTEQNLRDMGRLQLIAASSVGFLYSLGDSYWENLGDHRMRRLYPHRSFAEYGVVAPGNSDSPVTEGNPWLGIYGAVTRTTCSGRVLDDDQNISVGDALRAYTSDAAYASFEERSLGSIAVGAVADLNVVDQDPYEVDAQDLKDIRTAYTYVAGRQVYSAVDGGSTDA